MLLLLLDRSHIYIFLQLFFLVLSDHVKHVLCDVELDVDSLVLEAKRVILLADVITECIVNIDLAHFIFLYFDVNVEILAIESLDLLALLKHVNLEAHLALTQAVRFVYYISGLLTRLTSDLLASIEDAHLALLIAVQLDLDIHFFALVVPRLPPNFLSDFL